jgi:hypothetical protein
MGQSRRGSRRPPCEGPPSHRDGAALEILPNVRMGASNGPRGVIRSGTPLARPGSAARDWIVSAYVSMSASTNFLTIASTIFASAGWSGCAL